MSSYSIKDLERLTGIKAHTLRIWEQRYNILRPTRSATNIRSYADNDLRKILNISLLNNHGFKISAIAGFTEKKLHDEVRRILSNSNNENHQIEALLLSVLSLDEDGFEKTLDKSIQVFGYEKTVEHVIFPFLRQLGQMWQVGTITPAQEHYISNLIRQKMIAGLDKLSSTNKGKFTYLFFLPEKELHELGLIYLHYLAKKQQHKCYYLGQSVPLADLISVAEKVKPDFLVTIITTTPNTEELQELVETCQKHLKGSELLMSGRYFFEGAEKAKGSEKYFFKNFEEFRQFL